MQEVVGRLEAILGEQAARRMLARMVAQVDAQEALEAWPLPPGVPPNGPLAERWPRMAAFLWRFANSGNVRLSCQSAGIARRQAYRWKARYKTFAKAWDEAKEMACDLLEATAWTRATAGMSDKLLMFLLKAYRREVFGDETAVRLTEPVVFTVRRDPPPRQA